MYRAKKIYLGINRVGHVSVYAKGVIYTLVDTCPKKRRFLHEHPIDFYKCALDEILPLLAHHHSKNKIQVNIKLSSEAYKHEFIEKLKEKFYALYNQNRELEILINDVPENDLLI